MAKDLDVSDKSFLDTFHSMFCVFRATTKGFPALGLPLTNYAKILPAKERKNAKILQEIIRRRGAVIYLIIHLPENGI